MFKSVSFLQNAADGGGGDFNWDESQQGLVLGGFSFGYFSTLLLGGILAERLNAKWVFGLGVFFTSVPALLAPLIAGVHVNMFIALRAFQGAAQGPTLPAMYVMSAKWLPMPEKTRLFTVIMTGLHFGTILGFPISGTIAHNLGWRGIFYTFGSCGIVWFALWIFLVYESPAMHPRISAAEREYIEANTPKQTMATKRLPPLLKVMTTPSFLALIVAYMGYNWGLHTMMTSGPIYMSTILHLSTADVSLKVIEIMAASRSTGRGVETLHDKIFDQFTFSVLLLHTRLTNNSRNS
jgi:ACS family sodium-dependent inorganic phosphate cotransporter-like MFS transporter 5